MNSSLNERSQDDNSLFDLGRIIRSLLMQSKLIIFVTILGLSLGVLYYINSTKIYKINSLLQITSPQANNLQNPGNFDFFLGSSTNDVENLLILYKSRSSILKLIDEFNLDLKIDGIKAEDSLTINKLDIQNSDVDLSEDPLKINLSKDNYSIDVRGETREYLDYGVLHSIDGINISINAQVDQEKEVAISKLPIESVYKLVSRNLNVTSTVRRNSYFRSAGIVQASYITDDTDLGMRIVNSANKNFIESNIKSETETAREAIKFINERIELTENVLSRSKTQLKEFQENNKSINVDLETESIISNVSNIEEQIRKLDLEIAKAETLYTETNPIYQNLVSQKQAIQKQKNEIEEEIKSLPVAQQEFIDLFRNVQITEELYSELVTRRLSLSIVEASTLGNIRIIDEAYVQSRISPELYYVFLSLILSFALSVIFAIFRGRYFLPITNPAELMDGGITTNLIGVVPKFDTEKPIEQTDITKFSSCFESLVLNIETLQANNNKNLILITSATANNGKSYVSRNIARKLSQIGKKVLLIDNDLKRGSQHKELGKSTISSDEFLQIKESNFENYRIDEKFYFIPKISKLRDTFKFLYSPAYKNKLDLFKENFDFVILDSAPLLAVSDTAILMTMTDYNFSVARHGLTKINEAAQLVQISQQTGSDIDGFIYNAYEKPSSYYGYYGLYGNYSYQYYANRYLNYEYDYDQK